MKRNRNREYILSEYEGEGLFACLLDAIVNGNNAVVSTCLIYSRQFIRLQHYRRRHFYQADLDNAISDRAYFQKKTKKRGAK